MADRLASHIAAHLRDRSVDITAQWVRILQERLGLEAERTLPDDSILNHIPNVLRTVADFIEDPGDMPVDALVRRDLSQLADLRRSQGFTLAEVLSEFGILSGLIEDSITGAVEAFEAECGRTELIHVVGRLKDAIFVLGTETAARYRQWHERRQQERIRLIEAYTAMLSHELGNRLGSAETAVQLILEEGDNLEPDRVDALHELILQSLASGRETVQSVRALFRPATVDTIRKLPLRTIIQDAVHEMRIAAAERGIEIELADPGPDDPIDAERLPLVFFNLVTNAIRHHDAPGGSGRIVVDIDADPDRWMISVTDDGPGIPDDLRGQLFEPLVRNREGDGAGLGLAIAREAVDQMGGRIWFEPASPRGTRFTFTIPR